MVKKIPTFLNYPDLYDRLIVLNGWSKTYAMTGWRLGWSVWPEKLIEHVFKFCVNSHSCVNTACTIWCNCSFRWSRRSSTRYDEKNLP